MSTPAAADPLPTHVDETGAPCPRHPPISMTSLFQLAMVGSRAPAFHHDCASKLQGLVMALDELTELTENGDPHLIRAVETAMEASRELNALLNLNRTLTRSAPKMSIAVEQLLARAAERVGTSLTGALPPGLSVSVGVAPLTHALALVLDVAAGAGRGRTVPMSATVSGGRVEIALGLSPQSPPNAGEQLAIASFVVSRDGRGRMWCSAGGELLMIELPMDPPEK